jgi:pilus assembly protein Flp/PilA
VFLEGAGDRHGAGGRMDKLRSLVRSRDGATAVEYGLIAALISVGLLLGFQGFSNELQNVLTLIADAIENSWA